MTGIDVPEGGDLPEGTGVSQGADVSQGIARRVLTVPHPLLTERARPADPGDPRTAVAVADLLATLRRLMPYTGLSAPQIGMPLRIIAFDVSRHPHARSCAGEVVLLNPRLVAASRWEPGREGCVSVPGFAGGTVRAARISVRGDLPGGASVTVHADTVEARCVQHQLDHLDGTLFLDRISEAGAFHPAWLGTAVPALTRPEASQPAPMRGS
ncbi:peptide deformylase [Sinosporangium siamense]|uniref:Peptide deformylase-like n=1 Tax=Sinosporangium siamense TaxID=1367973 RepID=A0A919V8H6_9ACTN|nr:peptide deformylase [Sinosporangium siamense]GII93242.1 hypothetical protein Ssi02_34730 [Sinosporangium siamense]